MKRIRLVWASLCIIILLLPHVLAFTKSQEFVGATQPKEGATGRVGISAGQFAPKEPRFKKFIPPRIIPSITVLTVGFRDILANEPPPIITPIDEFRKQQEEREKEREKQKQEETQKQETPEEKEDQEKKQNIRNAILSVKSARVPDQRVSAQAGSILSLAIILIGLGAYSVMRFAGKRP